MKSNGLLKWLMIPLALIVVFVGFKLFSGPEDKPSAQPSNLRGESQLTPDEMKTLGIDGDTPRDTIATLVGEVKDLRSELKEVIDESKEQKASTERMRQRESSIEQRIQTALNSERERSSKDREQTESELQQTQSLLQDLRRRLDGIGSKAAHTDLPVGLGLEEGDTDHSDSDGVRWIEPQDARRKNSKSQVSKAESEFQFPTSFESAPDRAQKTLDTAAERITDLTDSAISTKTSKPIYTIPSNATLMGSIAMTALIGRVPIDGTVNDPFPFKIIVGPDNLTANGIDLPDVAGAVVSGTASGDRTLSCVRGEVRSITFVFDDGTIRTVPEKSFANRDRANDSREGLGWISDPYGIPCVSGELRSNAQEYLASQMLITAAGAGAASLIDSKNGSAAYISGSNGTTIGTVGITESEAMERVLAGGVQEMSQWVNKLYGQAFAAVYVQPNAKVAVHIEQPIEIDYEAQGRKVDYYSGDIHVSELD